MKLRAVLLMLLIAAGSKAQYNAAYRAVAAQMDSLLRLIISDNSTPGYTNSLTLTVEATFYLYDDFYPGVFNNIRVSRDTDADNINRDIFDKAGVIFLKEYAPRYFTHWTEAERSYVSQYTARYCECCRSNIASYTRRFDKLAEFCNKEILKDTAFLTSVRKQLTGIDMKRLTRISMESVFYGIANCDVLKKNFFDLLIEKVQFFTHNWAASKRGIRNYPEALLYFYKEKNFTKLAEKFPDWKNFDKELQQLAGHDSLFKAGRHEKVVKLAAGGLEYSCLISNNELLEKNMPAGRLYFYFESFAVKPVIKSIRFEKAKPGETVYTYAAESPGKLPPPPPPPPGYPSNASGTGIRLDW